MIDLRHGDCLVEMNSIADKSVDMILCDLPYGVTPCKWDVVIPFEPLWAHYKRVIKDNGAIALFGNEPFSSYLRMSNIGQFKYDWIWIKKKNMGVGFMHAKNAPIRIIETISIFSKAGIIHKGKGGRMEYSPLGLIDCSQKEICRLPKEGTVKERLYRKSMHGHERKLTNYPVNVLEIDFVQNEKRPRAHPTQKPVLLLEYLIKTYTTEGELVLDNCMGSGSTGVACKNLNRRFIGIEKEEKYFLIAQNRTNQLKIITVPLPCAAHPLS